MAESRTILTCLVICLAGTQAFIFSTVPCPNMASNCITDTFNTIMPNLGCLGCQGGCVEGYMMTNNPKHTKETNNPQGTYIFNEIPVKNTVDVFQPQWVCTPGDKCQAGYFLSQMGGQTACAYCGEGCRSCSGYNNCNGCFGGFSLSIRTLPGGKQVANCKNSGVLCPTQASNCMYPVYVSSGAGCLGCMACEEGYLPTFNPSYYNHSRAGSDTYTYRGITVRGDRDVYQPRFVCVKGGNCRAGWYKREVAGSTVCDWCGEGCAECKMKGACTSCETGYTLDTSGACAIGTSSVTIPITASSTTTPTKATSSSTPIIDVSSITTPIEVSSTTTQIDASSTTTQIDASSTTTQVDASSTTTQVDASSTTTQVDASSTTTQVDVSSTSPSPAPVRLHLR